MVEAGACPPVTQPGLTKKRRRNSRSCREAAAAVWGSTADAYCTTTMQAPGTGLGTSSCELAAYRTRAAAGQPPVKSDASFVRTLLTPQVC
jgi:hypothetical protein